VEPERATRIPALVALATTGAALVHALTFSGCNVDDAYISYRYALHLAHGAGLVFNPGERVEGYTNFLWTVLAALSLRLRLPAPLVLPLLSLASLVALVLVTLRGARALRPDTAAPHPVDGLFAGLVVAASAGLAYHSFAGLETVPFALAWTLAALSAVRGRPWSFALSGAVAFLLRPEAGLLLAWGAATLLLLSPAPRRDVLRAGSALALALVAYLGWKLWYFGELLPNTLRAKLPDRALGLRYLLDWSTLAGGLLLVALGALPSMTRAARALLSLVALHTLAVVFEGGDWMFGYRLLLPSLPCLAMALDAPVVGLLPPPRWRLPRAAAALAAIAALSLWSAQNLRVGALIRESNLLLGAQDLSRASLARELLSRGARSAALYDIGVFGYAVPSMRIADLGGLTDRDLASRPGGLGRKQVDDAWMRARDPDVVLANAFPVALPGRAEALLRVQWPVERRLLGLPGFAARYVPECVASVGGHYLLLVYRRRDGTLSPAPPRALCTSLGEALRRTVRWHPEMAAEHSPD